MIAWWGRGRSNGHDVSGRVLREGAGLSRPCWHLNCHDRRKSAPTLSRDIRSFWLGDGLGGRRLGSWRIRTKADDAYPVVGRRSGLGQLWHSYRRAPHGQNKTRRLHRSHVGFSFLHRCRWADGPYMARTEHAGAVGWVLAAGVARHRANMDGVPWSAYRAATARMESSRHGRSSTSATARPARRDFLL